MGVIFGDSLVFLDLETTGLFPTACDIIEIGAWLFTSGVVVKRFHQRIKPERYISEEVRKLTGITNEDLENCDTITQVLPEFCDFCDEYPICGYNLNFDYNFLCSKSRIIGYDFSLRGMRTGIDVLKCVKQSYPNMDSYKLCDVLDSLKVPFDAHELHTALYDAYVTKLVFDRCRPMKPYLLDATKYGRPIITDTLDFE